MTMEVKKVTDEKIPIDTFLQMTDQGQMAMLTRAPPVVDVLDKEETLFRKIREKNKYVIYRALYARDPELAGAINTIAFMVQRSYDGIVIKPGVKLDAGEQKTLEEAQLLAMNLNFPKLFHNFAKRLLIYGDAIDHIIFKQGVGVTELQPIPISKLTILQSPEQKHDAAAQVFEANDYYLNEDQTNEKHWKKDVILHVSLDNRASEIEDTAERYTFGIWSESPIEALSTMIRWKHNMIENDIIWRHRNLPREHHKLDLSMFDPKMFKGTTKDRIEAATKAAQEACNLYAEAIKKKEADQGFVTDMNTEITYVEPTSTTYSDPNKLLDQMNLSIVAVMGVPMAALGSSSTSYATVYESSGYAVMRAESIAENIKTMFLERIVKKHLILKGMTEHMDKLDIRINLMLAKDRGELARQIALLVETGCFTITELRSLWGLDALTDKQKKEIAEAIKRIHTRTPAEIKSDKTKADIPKDESSFHPDYPGEKRERQQT